jgi:hypothetical protein
MARINTGTRQHETVQFGCRIPPDVRKMLDELVTQTALREQRYVTTGEIVAKAIRTLHAKEIE